MQSKTSHRVVNKLTTVSGGTSSAGILLDMLDAVRRSVLRADLACGPSTEPYRVQTHVVPGHVQLRNQPDDLRVEKCRVPSGVRQVAAMQEARHVRVPRLARPGEEAGLRCAPRELPDPVHAARSVSRRTAGAAALCGTRDGHGALQDHRERGLR